MKEALRYWIIAGIIAPLTAGIFAAVIIIGFKAGYKGPPPVELPQAEPKGSGRPATMATARL